MEGELSKVPYLIGAMRQWAMDAGYTPHLMVEAEYPGVKLPLGKLSIENGLVLLNVHNRAVDRYEIVDEWILFATRFSGQVYQVELPVESVIFIMVPETLDNLSFRDYPAKESSPDNFEEPPKSEIKKGKPHLKLVE